MTQTQKRRTCLGANYHVGTVHGARWNARGVCPSCGKNLKLTSGGRIPAHVPAKVVAR